MGRRKRQLKEAGKRNSKKDQQALHQAIRSILLALPDADIKSLIVDVNKELNGRAKIAVEGEPA